MGEDINTGVEMSDTQRFRRQSDSEIVEIRGQIKHLAENDQRLFDSITRLQTEYESGFKDLRELITNQNKPHWQLYLAFIVVIGGFFAFQVQQIKEPIERDLAVVRDQQREIKKELRHHTENGHPYTVLSRIDNLERSVNAKMGAITDVQKVNYDHLSRWLKRVDEKGSVANYGKKSGE